MFSPITIFVGVAAHLLCSIHGEFDVLARSNRNRCDQFSSSYKYVSTLNIKASGMILTGIDDTTRCGILSVVTQSRLTGQSLTLQFCLLQD